MYLIAEDDNCKLLDGCYWLQMMSLIKLQIFIYFYIIKTYFALRKNPARHNDLFLLSLSPEVHQLPTKYTVTSPLLPPFPPSQRPESSGTKCFN